MNRTHPATQHTHRIREDAGAAAVEFALVLPLVMLLLFGIIEFGRAWNVKQVLTDAAREGARAAVVNNMLATDSLQTLVKSTVKGAAGVAGLNVAESALVITLTGVPGTSNTPAKVALKYNYVPLFGTWVLKANAIPIQTSFTMRNE